jgi:hypothetical protein
MAIIQCPECKKNISDQAVACPDCAFPIKAKATVFTKNAINENRKSSIFRIIIVLFLILISIYCFIWYTGGADLANNTVATIIKQPIELTNETFNLKASSIVGKPIKLPYSGKLDVWVDVEDGNNIDIYLVDQGNIDNAIKDTVFHYLSNYIGRKTKTFHANDMVGQGLYYIVIKDETLGILSKSTSRITIKAMLNP